MNLPRLFFLLPWVAVVVLSSSACISVPDIEPAKAEVRIASPEATAYTNGVLEVRLTVTGHAPERVEPLKDGEVLATLEAPYTYAWDTAREAEGTHRLEARAVLGDETFRREARDVVVDRTPPQVVSRTPEPGAQEVWVKSPIQAVFSEPVKVTEASVRLTVGGVDVARTVRVSADGRTVTVEPAATVTAPSELVLALADALVDRAGNKASETASEWDWVMPEFVPYPLLSSKPPEPIYGRTAIVRLDKSGTPFVLVREFDGQSVNLFVSRWTGSAWESLGSGLKTSPPNFEISSPSLQIAPDGNPVVAWHEGVGTETDNHIHVARWTGSTWVRLSGEQGILPNRPHALAVSLQLTTSGQPVVAFNMDPEDIDGKHVLVYRWNENGWEPIGTPINGDPSWGAASPVLALDATDTPIVAFTQQDSKRIYVWRHDGSDWNLLGTTVNTYSDQHGVRNISLSITRDNQPSVFWINRNGITTHQSLLAKTWSGSAWLSLDVPSSANPTSKAAAPTTCLDSSGSLLVAWIEFEDTQNTLRLHRQTGSSWEELWSTADLFNSSPRRISSLSVDANAHGDIALAWIDHRLETQDIHVYRLNR